MQVKEDIESEIEDCKEEVYEHSYALRWFSFGTRFFWFGAIIFLISAGSLVIISPLNIPLLQPVLQSVATASGITTGVVGFITGVSYLYDSSENHGEIADHLKELREAKRELEKLLRRLAYFDEHSSSYLTPAQYMHQLPTLIISYRKQADSYRRWFIVTQIITILLSAAVTSLSGGWVDKYISIPWTIPVFSALISILTSFTLFFKLREKGTNLQQTADAMDLEHKACNLSIGPYKGLARDEALILLAERTEALRKEQQQRQQQLEQSSQAEQKALQVDK